jgi:hypothetical protein
LWLRTTCVDIRKKHWRRCLISLGRKDACLNRFCYNFKLCCCANLLNAISLSKKTWSDSHELGIYYYNATTVCSTQDVFQSKYVYIYIYIYIYTFKRTRLLAAG